VIVVDGGSHDDTLARARPLADRVIGAARGRASQMNAGAAIARHDVLLFLHADTRLAARRRCLIARAIESGRRWGRFDVAIDGRRDGCRDRGRDEPALAPDRHRDRRPGNVRRARAVRVGRRLPADRADGRHRTFEPAQAPRRPPACLRERVRTSDAAGTATARGARSR
jgi:glycosyltransferase involved in cell wall biosynthesis